MGGENDAGDGGEGEGEGEFGRESVGETERVRGGGGGSLWMGEVCGSDGVDVKGECGGYERVVKIEGRGCWGGGVGHEDGWGVGV